MTFRSDAIEEFKSVFEKSKPHILEFEGCHEVQLLQDKNDPRIIMTYSIWKNEAALNNYRTSEFFGETWKRTKTLFLEKPEAWSLETEN
jgi:heme-degrading monooxygenase HmoA